MNRLVPWTLAALLLLMSEAAFALCGGNICSAELPNDADRFRAVGRINVLLTSSPQWSTAYSSDKDDADPFEGSCECKQSQALAARQNLDEQLAELKLSYDHYIVECFMVPPEGGERRWIPKGRFNVGDIERSFSAWGRFFCPSLPFHFLYGSDLVASRFDIAQAFMNDTDLDGLGAGDDRCDNSRNAGPNFGWDAHHTGTLEMDVDAGESRGCFGIKEWPAPETSGFSVQSRCTATVSGLVLKASTRTEIFSMNSVAPALVLGKGDDLKAAAQTIFDLNYAKQSEVYAHCRGGKVTGPFRTAPFGKDYAEWQAAAGCGGRGETLEFEYIPLVSQGALSVSCTVENDADGDGVGNQSDVCPLTPRGTAVYPDSVADAAKRGCPIICAAGEEFVEDRCQLRCPASSLRAGGGSCRCEDSTVFDPSAGNICEDKDEDRDGVPYPVDQCLRSSFPAIVNAMGCDFDEDGDAISDRLDRCSLTPRGSMIDAHGCGLDTDRDGIEDEIEYKDESLDCSQSEIHHDDGSIDLERSRSIIRTRAEFGGKYLGCFRKQLDSDGDSVANAVDLCPKTPPDEAASRQCSDRSRECGCSFSDLDQDSDGVRNADDICPSSPGSLADRGCAQEDRDALPSNDRCPVPSFKSITQDFYTEIVAKGQGIDCQELVNVVDPDGRAYGSVCKGTEGYLTYELEKNWESAVSISPSLQARSACYQRGHSGASVRAAYISPLYKEHHVKIWRNREQLERLAASNHFACSALLNDYNVHALAYHGLAQQPEERLDGEDRGEVTKIFGAGPLDVAAEAACGLYREAGDPLSARFFKLYP